MATFVIEDKKKQEELWRCEPRTIVGSRAYLGSSSDCEFKIKDYVLAPKHCRILETEKGFELEDLSGSGTYVDGEPVSRRLLESGCRVVLGTSQLDVTIDPAEKKITLRRDDFRFDPARDPLLWSRTELGLGRFPPLSWANAGALLGICILGGWFCFAGSRREALLEPGALRHREVAGAALTGKGCDACHSPRERASTASCAAAGCHLDLAGGTRHPFGVWADFTAGDARDRPLNSTTGALACRDCHVEHRKDIIPSAPLTCAPCHGESLPAPVKAPPVPPSIVVGLSYGTFSHEAHAKAHNAGSLQCGDCHRRATEGEERLDHSEFARVTFERCGECHDPKKERKIRGKDLPAEWHGAEADGGRRCRQCHDKLHQGGPRLVQREKLAPGSRKFGFLTRSHVPEVQGFPADEAHAGLEPCGKCHRRGLELRGGRALRERPFEHEQHLREEPSGKECERCHASVALASALPAGASLFDEKACAEACHVDPQAKGALASPVLAQGPFLPAMLEQPDFPHDRHSRIEGGCSACHVHQAQMLSPATPQDVKDCSRCHDRRHDRIGGGSCAFCHVMESEPGPRDDLVYAERPFAWSRPTDPDFSHWSRGHRESTESGRCTPCHDEGGTWGARRIEAVPIPTEDRPACRACHMAEGGRVHWR